MPSFYCCSLNCWFFFFTGVEKGILLVFLLFQRLSCYQLCSPNFVGPAVGYCPLFCSVVLPDWGGIREIEMSYENSSYLLLLLMMVRKCKWKWRKQEISLVAQFQLCFYDLQTGLYGWMTHDGRQIQSIHLLHVNINGWKTDLTLTPLLVFLSGTGSISQSLSVMTSGRVWVKTITVPFSVLWGWWWTIYLTSTKGLFLLSCFYV